MITLAGNIFFLVGLLGLLFGNPWCVSNDVICLFFALVSWISLFASTFILWRGIFIKELRRSTRNKYVRLTLTCSVIFLLQLTLIGFFECLLTLLALSVLSLTPDELFPK